VDKLPSKISWIWSQTSNQAVDVAVGVTATGKIAVQINSVIMTTVWSHITLNTTRCIFIEFDKTSDRLRMFANGKLAKEFIPPTIIPAFNGTNFHLGSNPKSNTDKFSGIQFYNAFWNVAILTDSMQEQLHRTLSKKYDLTKVR
jgi:hypothetical protein